MAVVARPPQLAHDPPERTDIRVLAVREVLSGDGFGEVARRHDVDVALLHRWVTAFVDAGTAAVTNRPALGSHAQRDRFLAAFAHETRTPLAAARGWVDLLREGAVPPHRVGATLARLDEALGRLAEHARDVELLAAASLGLVHPRPVVVTLGDLLVEQRGCSVAPADAGALLFVDPELVGRVLRDLVAAAGLPPGPSTARAYAAPAGPWTELSVVRTGRPIPHAVLHALFEPFDLNDDGSGITIGLYLARALAVAQGGAVGVDQEEDTTTFWVRVPGNPAATRAAADTEEEPMKYSVACGDVMPGCSARFESTTRDDLMRQVGEHAAAEHGLTDITPEVRSSIEDKIVTTA